ncbi:FAD synthase [uncultured archaeon]|nr:FAD synthase [uncultured archaeon]
MMPIDNLENYNSENIVNMEKAEGLIWKFKESGKKVGLCHGGFDLLHPGHVKHLESAKNLCDLLFVSVTSDKFVSMRKETRPIFHENLRAYMLSKLRCVDYVVISDYNLGVETIKKLKPSLYIKGPDYKNSKDWEINEEREAVERVGGKIIFTDDLKLSTTEIISYIKKEIKN